MSGRHQKALQLGALVVSPPPKKKENQTGSVGNTSARSCNMGGSKSFRHDQLFKVTEIKQLCYFSIQSPFISTHTDTDTLTSPQMALYIPRSIFHLARLLYVRPETFGSTDTWVGFTLSYRPRGPLGRVEV